MSKFKTLGKYVTHCRLVFVSRWYANKRLTDRCHLHTLQKRCFCMCKQWIWQNEEMAYRLRTWAGQVFPNRWCCRSSSRTCSAEIFIPVNVGPDLHSESPRLPCLMQLSISTRDTTATKKWIVYLHLVLLRHFCFPWLCVIWNYSLIFKSSLLGLQKKLIIITVTAWNVLAVWFGGNKLTVCKKGLDVQNFSASNDVIFYII